MCVRVPGGVGGGFVRGDVRGVCGCAAVWLLCGCCVAAVWLLCGCCAAVWLCCCVAVLLCGCGCAAAVLLLGDAGYVPRSRSKVEVEGAVEAEVEVEVVSGEGGRATRAAPRSGYISA